MADPLSAGIGAVGSLLGGIFGKSKTIDPRESVTLHTRGIRQASEWYGFNPLTLLQNVSPSSTVTGPNPMGSAIADAAMFAADAFLKKGNQQALLVNEYQRQNKELQDRLTHVTLQPKVPGVYGGGDGVGTRQAAGAAGDYEAGGLGVGAADPVDPDLTHTYRAHANDDAVTNVPVGPDIDEVVSGALIAAYNKRKGAEQFKLKNRDTMTWGEPLSVPFGVVDRTWELMPPVRKAKPKGKPKSTVRYGVEWVQ